MLLLGGGEKPDEVYTCLHFLKGYTKKIKEIKNRIIHQKLLMRDTSETGKLLLTLHYIY